MLVIKITIICIGCSLFRVFVSPARYLCTVLEHTPHDHTKTLKYQYKSKFSFKEQIQTTSAGQTVRKKTRKQSTNFDVRRF